MKKILFTVVFGLSLVLSACGPAKPTTTIDVSLTDFQFQPAKFTIPAAKEITLNATNTGTVTHSFVIMKLGTNAGDVFDEQDIPNVYWDVEIQPGSQEHITFTAPSDPGNYQLVCKTPGHLAAGMTGTITVVAGE